MVNRQVPFVSAVAAALLIGAMPGLAASAPATTMPVPSSTQTSSAKLVNCPRHALPLTAESVARAADQARVEAASLYKGFGPAVVELAWRAKFRLNIWASTPFDCSDKVRRRTVVVDLLFPKMLPSASLSEGVVLVSRFPAGYRVWEVGH
jgi:hypothetical protein